MPDREPRDDMEPTQSNRPEEARPSVFRWRPRSIARSLALVTLGLYALAQVIAQHAKAPQLVPSRTVDLRVTAPRPSGPAQVEPRLPLLRVAIAPVLSPESSVEIYQDFVRYLARKVDRAPLLTAGKNYAEVNNLIRYQLCDLALVCTFPYVRGQKQFGMEAIAAPVVRGKKVYHAYIIAQRSSAAQDLLGLRRRRFASSDLLSSSGWLFPMVWLRENGQDPAGFFEEHLITGSHDRSIRAVASGFVDGAAVHSLIYDRLVEDDPSIAEKTKVIGRSSPFGTPPFVVPHLIDPALKSALQDTLLHMHEDPEARKLLSVLKIDRFEKPDDRAYDNVRELVRKLDTTR